MKNRSKISVTILAVLACFALLPAARAVSPEPDGCYPNFTTAEGCNALKFLDTGIGNTGIGWDALLSTDDSSFNTAIGAGALLSNKADSNTAVGAGALLLNTTGTQNVAIGTDAMVFNGSSSFNNAVGALALFNNDSSGHGAANFNNALAVARSRPMWTAPKMTRLATWRSRPTWPRITQRSEMTRSLTTRSRWETAVGREAGDTIIEAMTTCVSAISPVRVS